MRFLFSCSHAFPAEFPDGMTVLPNVGPGHRKYALGIAGFCSAKGPRVSR